MNIEHYKSPICSGGGEYLSNQPFMPYIYIYVYIYIYI